MDTPRFKAPKLELKPTILAEIPFEGAVAGGGYLTLVSGYIPHRYRVIRAKMFFTAAAANLVQHRWYVSRDSTAPPAAWPMDTNLYGRLSPTATFVGLSLIRQVAANIEVLEEGTYLKFSTFNGLGVAYQANGSITIEEMIIRGVSTTGFHCLMLTR
ncbi:unnamed protein product [marine sediment metagenome]|uniref:Uncharacterized protein n=1 Tax=marine sediment metagenome TaxID=412755 RepID=X1RRA1_9ZZZZ